MASSRSSVLSPARPKALLGHEAPRVFTPPLRPLTPKTSAGFALIAFAEEVLGMELLPWQKWLAIHSLEMLPDGTFRFRTVVLLVARQNGKSTFLQVLALFFLYVRGVALVIGTAQNLDIAEEVWQGAVDIAQDVPDLAAEIERVTMVNGKKALELRHGERYKVQAANRRGGRGLSGDLVMLDELREHQSWDAWGAVTKTTMARALAQVWAASNAGDGSSVVLRFLRLLAHLSLGDPDGLAEEWADAAPDEIDEPDDDSMGIFEWSAPAGCAITDRAGWAAANPSLGHTITERAIASAMRTDPEAVFRTEVLCQWVSAMSKTAIDPDLWASLADVDAARGQSPVFAVAVAPDRSWAAVVAAWRKDDGTPHVTLVDYRPTATWVTARVAELRGRWHGQVVASTTARELVPGADEPSEGKQAQADNALSDATTAGALTHGNQPALMAAVRAARWRKSGASRTLEAQGDYDISPLKAAALAVHALTAAGPSVYEERGFVVI